MFTTKIYFIKAFRYWQTFAFLTVILLVNSLVSCVSNSDFNNDWDKLDSVVSHKVVVPEEMKEAVWGNLPMPDFYFVFYPDSAVFVSEENGFRNKVNPADVVKLMNKYYDRIYPRMAAAPRKYTANETRWRNRTAEELVAIAAQAAGFYPEAQYEWDKLE